MSVIAAVEDTSIPRQFVADSKEIHMKLEANIERFLGELGGPTSRHGFMHYDNDKDERSRRPNEWHRRSFKRGWGDAEKVLIRKRGRYTDDTLRYLTWCDLGYRFVLWLHVEGQQPLHPERAYEIFRKSLKPSGKDRFPTPQQNPTEDRVTDKTVPRRCFWVVSPNVRNDYRTVSLWKQASVRWKAAFMGWDADDKKHKQIGYKFARVVRPNDILLIARRHQNKPEVVGCGVVVGTYKTSLKGFKPPQEFGSLRLLSPFKALRTLPPKLPIMDALGQTTALRKLHPTWNPKHRTISEWMERTLAERGRPEVRPRKRTGRLAPSGQIVEVELPSKPRLRYLVMTQRKARLATKAETKLVHDYRSQLHRKHRELKSLKLGNLQCDAYDKARNNLIEAKASCKREHIRMAVGELFDYAFLGRKEFGKPNMAILLPQKPDPKSVEWLRELQIGVVWKEKDKFLDNANGQFT